MITTNESDVGKDFWSLMLSVDGKDTSDEQIRENSTGQSNRGCTHLDHGAQVTNVRRQLAKSRKNTSGQWKPADPKKYL